MTQIKVLDKGFVRLVDSMGDDSSIVQAARVSFGKGTKTPSEDRALIRYMMRNRHTSVFEQVVIKLHIKMPIFLARQWFRHRSASANELSGRYSEMEDEFFVPDSLRLQSTTNKQGGSALLDPNVSERFVLDMTEEQRKAYKHYEQYLEAGVSREQARINLPVSLYTQFFWTQNLHNLLHLINLRSDSHAQTEMQFYGHAVKKLIKPIAPVAIEAFEDYVQNAKTFSKAELDVIKTALESIKGTQIGVKENLISYAKDTLSGRELTELIAKLTDS